MTRETCCADRWMPLIVTRTRLIVGLGVTVVLLLLTFVTGARNARAGASAVQALWHISCCSSSG